MTETKTITTATPSVAPPQLLRHVIRRKRGSDGAWGEWEERALCGVLWDKPFLRGGKVCEDCLDALKREANKENDPA